MATPLPVIFKASPLPVDFDGTPQQFLDALVARLGIQTNQGFVLVGSGGVLPTSDQGPFLLNGITWYVWDVSSGSYIPQILAAASLAGFAAYPAAARVGAAQTIPVDNAAHSVGFDTEYIDPNEAYNPALYRYTVQATGNYLISARAKVHNATGTAASMQLALNLFKNGAVLPYGAGGASTPSPSGSNWFLNFSVLAPLASTDFIEAKLTAGDGVNTGNVTVTEGDISISRIPNV